MQKLLNALNSAIREPLNYAAVIAIALFSVTVSAGFSQQVNKAIPLDIPADQQLRNVKTEVVTYKGKKALRVTDTAPPSAKDGERYVILNKTDVSDGTIEVELTGEPLAGAGEGARGFVGLAFRVSAPFTDALKYECFYLRPTNG